MNHAIASRKLAPPGLERTRQTRNGLRLLTANGRHIVGVSDLQTADPVQLGTLDNNTGFYRAGS